MSTIAKPLAPLAIALGDPAGVGPEVTAMAWEARHSAGLPPFFAVGSRASLAAVWNGPVEQITTPGDAAAVFDRALPLLQIDDPGKVVPGEPTLVGARCALNSLEGATGIVRTGVASALVTAPVSKAQLYAIGFTLPGQTEFVAERCGVAYDNAVMMLAGPDLRTVPVTIHVALADVPRLLTTELIVARGRTTARGLQRDFGISAPRIAVAGLNPHAGENGALGHEDIEIIQPAIDQLRAEGIDARGPLPADTLFHAHARATYDAALCMYHDQALIPVKALYFDEGVNITLGLPIVRTSPDHGTAFGIAGRGIARPDAMIAAIRLAAACAERRRCRG